MAKSKELLPVHASHMQREETGPKAIKRHQHRGHNLWGNPQPSLREAHGNPNSSSQANAVPCSLLILILFSPIHPLQPNLYMH